MVPALEALLTGFEGDGFRAKKVEVGFTAATAHEDTRPPSGRGPR